MRAAPAGCELHRSDDDSEDLLPAETTLPDADHICERRRRRTPNPQRSAPLQWGCDPSSLFPTPDRTPIRLALLAWLDERWRGDVYVPDELRPSCRRRSGGWPVIRGSRRRRNPPIAAGWAPRGTRRRASASAPSLAISSSRQPSEHVVHERFLCRGSVRSPMVRRPWRNSYVLILSPEALSFR